MDKLFELTVYNILRELQIPAHLKGYQFLKSALRYLRDNPNAIYSVTKDLYPGVAEMYDDKVEWTHVERGIRNAIRLSRASDETKVRVLGKKGHFANSEFIAALGETIGFRLDGDGGQSRSEGNDKYLEFHESRDELQMKPNDF